MYVYMYLLSPLCLLFGKACFLSDMKSSVIQVLNPAKITSEEYKTMVDLIIPLGRVPQTNSQTQ